MKNLLKDLLCFFMLWFVAGIAYLLAPFVALIRSIYTMTVFYSSKIIADVYPHRIEIMKGDNAPEVVKSKCCNEMVRAKFNGGVIQYFYCQRCGKPVPKEELEK